MTTVVTNFAVGNVDAFLAGGDVRNENLSKVCSSYRVFRHTDENRISVVLEDVDLEKMKTFLSSPEVKAARAKTTAIDPVDLYVEVEGAK